MFLLSALAGATLMFLFLRIQENRLERANDVMRILIERDRAEEALRRHWDFGAPITVPLGSLPYPFAIRRHGSAARRSTVTAAPYIAKLKDAAPKHPLPMQRVTFGNTPKATPKPSVKSPAQPSINPEGRAPNSPGQGCPFGRP